MSETWTTLLMAREAWDIGRPLESWQLMDEAQPDFELGRRTSRRTADTEMVHGWWEDVDDEDENGDGTYHTATAGESARYLQMVDWLAWQAEDKPMRLESFDAFLRASYPADGVDQFAMRTSTFYNLMCRAPGLGRFVEPV